MKCDRMLFVMVLWHWFRASLTQESGKYFNGFLLSMFTLLQTLSFTLTPTSTKIGENQMKISFITNCLINTVVHITTMCTTGSVLHHSLNVVHMLMLCIKVNRGYVETRTRCSLLVYNIFVLVMKDYKMKILT